jgi:glutamyl-tRNA reductase|nr:glutamyl-tRNA reductase [uncultured Ilyobacter sp.]
MRMDNFYAVGIDHKKVDMGGRESFIKKNPTEIFDELLENEKIKGYVNLSTCLRIEYYIHVEEGFTEDEIVGLFPSQEELFVKQGEDALHYLFRVICGFESVIKGEDQILAQVKKAHYDAVEVGTTSKVLNVIFNKAIEVGKKFRNESQIAHNALSLEAISLKFIKNNVENLENKNILILGVGDLSQGILYLLKKCKAKNIVVTNRSHHKALVLKDSYDVDVITFDQKVEMAINSDVIVSATSAPHFVLKSEDLMDRLDDGRKRFFLDLAVPRDIDEKLGELPNVDIYNLDHIWETYEKNVTKRENRLKEYSHLITEQIENVKKWFEYRERIA